MNKTKLLTLYSGSFNNTNLIHRPQPNSSYGNPGYIDKLVGIRRYYSSLSNLTYYQRHTLQQRCFLQTARERIISFYYTSRLVAMNPFLLCEAQAWAKSSHFSTGCSATKLVTSNGVDKEGKSGTSEASIDLLLRKIPTLLRYQLKTAYY